MPFCDRAHAGVEMIIPLSAMGFSAIALGRRFGIYTIATVAVMVCFAVWSAMDAPRIEAGLPTSWVGVKERIYWYAYRLWFIGLAFSSLLSGDLTGGASPSPFG